MSTVWSTERVDRALSREVKFLISASVGEAIRAWARRYMAPDPHGSGGHQDTYRTTTLYFDTRDFDVFHRRRSFGRSKYRVRRYDSSDLVFLERKMRTGERLSKRRTTVPLAEVARLEAPRDSSWAGAWLQRRLTVRQLAPVCVLRYRRTARLTPSAYGPARLTLDEQAVAWRTTQCSLDDQPAGTGICEGHVILELKYQMALPPLFKELAETFGLEPGKLSKYRLAAPALGLVPGAPTEAKGTPEACGTA